MAGGLRRSCVIPARPLAACREASARQPHVGALELGVHTRFKRGRAPLRLPATEQSCPTVVSTAFICHSSCPGSIGSRDARWPGSRGLRLPTALEREPRSGHADPSHSDRSCSGGPRAVCRGHVRASACFRRSSVKAFNLRVLPCRQARQAVRHPQQLASHAAEGAIMSSLRATTRWAHAAGQRYWTTA